MRRRACATKSTVAVLAPDQACSNSRILVIDHHVLPSPSRTSTSRTDALSTEHAELFVPPPHPLALSALLADAHARSRCHATGAPEPPLAGGRARTSSPRARAVSGASA
jgi:hypothetical protein